MTDHTTKILLFLIAVGLWLNLATSWFWQPIMVMADSATAHEIQSDVNNMQRDLRKIANGMCLGPICE